LVGNEARKAHIHQTKKTTSGVSAAAAAAAAAVNHRERSAARDACCVGHPSRDDIEEWNNPSHLLSGGRTRNSGGTGEVFLKVESVAK